MAIGPKRTVKRRAFLRYSLGAGTAGAVGAFGAASLGFLWPTVREGFGAVLPVGDAQAIADQINETRAPYRYAPGKLYIVTWDPTVRGADDLYGRDHPVVGGVGLMALYQHCPHLGCVVPWCQPSQWWECPCHGSKYNRWGEWVRGPAPRGLDQFPSEVDAEGRLLVNTGVFLSGTARTARVLEQDAEGPNCIDA